MAKATIQSKVSLLTRAVFIGATVSLVVVWAFWFSSEPLPSFWRLAVKPTGKTLWEGVIGEGECAQDANIRRESPELTFYDDPRVSYSIEKPMKNWDQKRRKWLKHHPSYACEATQRILVVTGTQPSVCKNPIGDHFLLRLFKNKVDYCRLHGYDIIYNNAYLQPKMTSYWAKIPMVRAAMVAHPEVEWIWWVDSDAVFTDMDFKLPLDKYRDYNLVVDGWPNMIYENRSWIGLNAGVFLIRNCQWSMDFMAVWADMGPLSPDFEKWGETLSVALSDKKHKWADDQSALVYLVLKERDTWGTKIYMENQYCFQGYWLGIVGTLDNITETYMEVERGVRRLRRRHAEKMNEWYSAQMEQYLREAGLGKNSGRRPFITHFTGCQPCSGEHNPIYTTESCWKGIEAALNFADNQVLRRYGFVHRDLHDCSSVSPLPFDFPT